MNGTTFSTTGGAAAGGLGAALSGLSSLASLAGPVGSVVGAGLDVIKAILPAGNPRVTFGAAANAEAPHRASKPADLSNWAQDDGNDFVNWANQYGTTVEAIGDAVTYNRAGSPGHTWEMVVAWYRAHPSQLKQDLIDTGGLRTSAATVPIQAVSQAAMHLPSSAQPILANAPAFDLFTGQPLAGNSLFGLGGGAAAPEPKTALDYLKILLGGAADGAMKAGMNTPAGQSAKSDGVKSWIQENQLAVGLTGLAVTWAFAKAFKIIK